jgi:hypothetical protein
VDLGKTAIIALYAYIFGFCVRDEVLRNTMNTIVTPNCILLFSTTLRGLKGHHQVEQGIKVIYIYIYTHTQFFNGIEISNPRTLYGYVSVHDKGTIAMGIEFI